MVKPFYYKGECGNVYLPSGRTITVADGFSGMIGVSTASAPAAVTAISNADYKRPMSLQVSLRALYREIRLHSWSNQLSMTMNQPVTIKLSP